MTRRCLACILSLFLFMNMSVFAQEDDLQAAVDHKVNKMKRELKLTDTQADAITPILKDYIGKRQSLIKETEEQGIIDHTSIKITLRAMKQKEYDQLSKILSPEQMKEWKNRENMMASLNPDGGGSMADDDNTTLTPNGASFKF